MEDELPVGPRLLVMGPFTEVRTRSTRLACAMVSVAARPAGIGTIGTAGNPTLKNFRLRAAVAAIVVVDVVAVVAIFSRIDDAVAAPRFGAVIAALVVVVLVAVI